MVLVSPDGKEIYCNLCNKWIEKSEYDANHAGHYIKWYMKHDLERRSKCHIKEKTTT